LGVSSERERARSRFWSLFVWAIRLIFALVFGMTGYQLVVYGASFGFYELTPRTMVVWVPIAVSMPAIVGFVLASAVLDWVYRVSLVVETALQGVPLSDILAGVLGLTVGLFLAFLLSFPLSDIPVVGRYLPILASLLLGYVGFTVAVKRREDLGKLLGSIGRLRDRFRRDEDKASGGFEDKQLKVIDTSAIIDGRILEVVRTGFLSGMIVVPKFVLSELQQIADSSDPIKRARGRRGLEVLQALREMPGSCVVMDESTLKGLDAESVDEGVLKLADKLGADLIVTDYNLNKVAGIRGIRVLNVNELANALRPLVMPGEELSVDVIRYGKEADQGVGYMEDGTMVVVEGGARFLGQRVEIVVTSVLQTSAGRMVFGRPRREGP